MTTESLSQNEFAKLVRITNKITIEQLADKLHVSMDYINGIETNRIALSDDIKNDYCAALGISRMFLDFFDPNYVYNDKVKSLVFSVVSKLAVISEKQRNKKAKLLSAERKVASV